MTAGMRDGNANRRATYEVKLVGDELHVSTRRFPNAPVQEMVAHRAPAGEGAMPVRIPPPALHKVRDNGLARTPPMGWNKPGPQYSTVVPGHGVVLLRVK